MNIMSLSFAFGDGLQATAVALIGRSLGAKDPDLGQGIRQNMPSDRCRYRGLPCCDLLFRCKRTLQPLLHRGTHYRDWNQDYACHYLRRYFPDLSGHLYGMSAWRRRYALYSGGFHDQRYFYPYVCFLFLRIYTRSWNRRHLDGCFRRPDFAIYPLRLSGSGRGNG